MEIKPTNSILKKHFISSWYILKTASCNSHQHSLLDCKIFKNTTKFPEKFKWYQTASKKQNINWEKKLKSAQNKKKINNKHNNNNKRKNTFWHWSFHVQIILPLIWFYFAEKLNQRFELIVLSISDKKIHNNKIYIIAPERPSRRKGSSRCCCLTPNLQKIPIRPTSSGFPRKNWKSCFVFSKEATEKLKDQNKEKLLNTCQNVILKWRIYFILTDIFKRAWNSIINLGLECKNQGQSQTLILKSFIFN